MGQPTKEELYTFCKTIFGERGESGKQAPTHAIGLIHGQEGVYVVKQGGPIAEVTAKSVVKAWKEKDWDGNLVDIWSVIDGRNLATSHLGKSEWTSFHAEALIVSAMMSANIITAASALKEGVSNNGGAIICSNCPACYHCAKMLDGLGIQYGATDGKTSLTGWWNPFVDKVYAQASEEFRTEVPGGWA